MWEGLRLFSPASFSSLPGWWMPDWDDAHCGYPPRTYVVDYLTRYEDRYDLDVMRPHRARAVTRQDTDPRGRLLIHAEEQFAGRHVVIVGSGNSAAQILAEVATVATTTWVTTRPPRFLREDVDGRVLFATARERINALHEGRVHSGVARLGDVVMVASVREARERGAERAADVRPPDPGGVAWADGRSQRDDSVIWCTGFRPALRHLRSLRPRNAAGHVAVGGRSGTQVLDEPRLHLVGYGDTGPLRRWPASDPPRRRPLPRSAKRQRPDCTTEPGSAPGLLRVQRGRARPVRAEQDGSDSAI
ncbi:MAG: hypothetical protein ABR500_07250 [Dermatophilaceae bacterium]